MLEICSRRPAAIDRAHIDLRAARFVALVRQPSIVRADRNRDVVIWRGHEFRRCPAVARNAPDVAGLSATPHAANIRVPAAQPRARVHQLHRVELAAGACRTRLAAAIRRGNHQRAALRLETEEGDLRAIGEPRRIVRVAEVRDPRQTSQAPIEHPDVTFGPAGREVHDDARAVGRVARMVPVATVGDERLA